MGLVGDLQYLSLADIIQINCIGRNTARLTVHYPIGDGVFYFADGDVVDAKLGKLTGVEAVYKALEYDQGSFRVDSGIRAPTRTINDNWSNILMEGLRLLDEARAGLIPGSAPLSAEQINATTTGASRVQNPFQILVSDLTKIKGIDGALAAARDGTLNACIGVNLSDKVGMMTSLLIYLNQAMATGQGRFGKVKQMDIRYGTKEVMVFDQGTVLVVIEFANTIRFETISPHIDRAFRKFEARSRGGTSALDPSKIGTGSMSGPPDFLPGR